jgi:hypothetical protein
MFNHARWDLGEIAVDFLPPCIEFENDVACCFFGEIGIKYYVGKDEYEPPWIRPHWCAFSIYTCNRTLYNVPMERLVGDDSLGCSWERPATSNTRRKWGP